MSSYQVPVLGKEATVVRETECCYYVLRSKLKRPTRDSWPFAKKVGVRGASE